MKDIDTSIALTRLIDIIDSEIHDADKKHHAKVLANHLMYPEPSDSEIRVTLAKIEVDHYTDLVKSMVDAGCDLDSKSPVIAKKIQAEASYLSELMKHEQPDGQDYIGASKESFRG